MPTYDYGTGGVRANRAQSSNGGSSNILHVARRHATKVKFLEAIPHIPGLLTVGRTMPLRCGGKGLYFKQPCFRGRWAHPQRRSVSLFSFPSRSELERRS
jgi:hypothetical protein